MGGMADNIREDQDMANEQGMTARVCAFVRAYHAQQGGEVLWDPWAGLLMTREEYEGVAQSMSRGIQWFCPGFEGREEQALAWVVTHQLAPAPLSRAAFAEEELTDMHPAQCVILGAGLDTTALRHALPVVEVDLPAAIEDKRVRLERLGTMPAGLTLVAADLAQAGWTAQVQPLLRAGERSFISMMGLSYYLPGEAMAGLASQLAELAAPGSRWVMDYPVPESSGETRRKQALAAAAGERMQCAWTREAMAALLEGAGWRVARDMGEEEITARYFTAYNAAHPALPMKAQAGVRFVAAVRA